ncbi:MAG: hypothetical protein H0W64_05450 [Gammaproteobacteria bacterium]|nr:hypothetical protein [Gammaproteobacteria bacterium]
MLSQATLFKSSQPNLKQRLTTALRNVNETCVFGTSNKMEDVIRTMGRVYFHQFRYDKMGEYVKKNFDPKNKTDHADRYYNPLIHPKLIVKTNRKWFYRYQDTSVNIPWPSLIARFPNLNPIGDPVFHLSKSHKCILSFALLAQTKRQGNCYDRACLLSKYLWENNKNIQRIEIIGFNFDHCVVMINRTGDLKDPKTWGHALIVDSWYTQKEAIYTPSEFNQRIKEVNEYINKEQIEQEKIGVSHRESHSSNDITWYVEDEIRPQQDVYPTYSHSPFYPVDYYYDVRNAYTLDLLKSEKDFPLAVDRATHEHQYKACLAEIVKTI